MLFVQGFLLVASILLLLFIAVYALNHLKTPGSLSLLFLMIGAIIWTAASLMELVSHTFEAMLFWRNIQQIGVFSVPITTLFFAVDFTLQPKLRKYAVIGSLISITSILLIFTNETHHLMRSGYRIATSNLFGETLIVTSTTLGTLLVCFNFVVPLFSVLILFDFRRKVAQGYRHQVSLIIYSFLLTFFVTWLKMAVLTDIGFYISISTLYSPSAVLLFYSIFRYDTLSLSPIARDKLFHVVKQGIVVVGKDGTIVDANMHSKHLLQTYHITEKELIGTRVDDLFSAYPDVIKMLDTESEKEIQVAGEGGPFFISLTSHPLFRRGQDLVGTVFMIQDITPKKRYELELKALSETDYLTQIRNRRSFLEAYAYLLKYCQERNGPLSMLVMDLDKFKAINDTYGHRFGDRVLRHIVKILQEYVKEPGIIGRIGGEEFGMLLPLVDRSKAYDVAEQIRKGIADRPLYVREHVAVVCTASIGVTDSESADKSFDEMFREADSAMYQAKELSRNCVVIYEQ